MATRRDFLKAASLLAGGVGMAGVIPEPVKRAFAIEPMPGSTYKDAEHNCDTDAGKPVVRPCAWRAAGCRSNELRRQDI